ncbi:acyl-CoA dehydrogenase, partial [Paenibacillus sepulcri]|nr:acyl-CoA dehydrogenase [Paenibacillus sepulcri]
GQTFDSLLGEEVHLVSMAKKIFLMTGGAAVQKFQTKLEEEQEVLSHLADMMIQLYAMESALLRTQQRIARRGEEKSAAAIRMTRIFIHEAFQAIEGYAKETLSAIEAGDMLRTQLSVLKKLTRRTSLNTIQEKRQIAALVIQSESYVH